MDSKACVIYDSQTKKMCYDARENRKVGEKREKTQGKSREKIIKRQGETVQRLRGSYNS